MTSEPQHITVCVCTYKRPRLLKRLLDEVGRQESDGRFTYSIVVADNDHLQSGKEVVSNFAAASKVRVQYCVEARQNIALARNKAVENATGDFVAFIDDDEFPATRWLLTLFEACHAYEVDGVIGPVKRYFDEQPPKWVIKGDFYERPTYPTGLIIDWTKGRTNNVLVKRSVVGSDTQAFRPEFRTGEDQDFFRRMIDKGHKFIWCGEAVVYEVVPPIRWKRTFMLRRALLRGTVSVLQPTFGAVDIAKALVAIPAYTVALPVALVLGHHRFMALLVRLCDHLGTLLSALGINPIREPYVTD
ncbi:MAG: glycosyltransferase family 2 protein [Candidatus Rokuibacteriota bacterium]|nr:MAG: glycosyltransferase family 2 protein [Candidatus Rokubacteria bacterium]